MEKEKWTLKDKLEMAEAVFTIIVSVMAIWGTIVAWENGFWHKLKHIADHMHQEFTQAETTEREELPKKIEQELEKTL